MFHLEEATGLAIVSVGVQDKVIFSWNWTVAEQTPPRAKEPSEVEVFNDPNADLVNLFQVLRDPNLFQQLRDSAESTLYARAEFDLAGEPTEELVERARRYLVRQRQSRGGLGQQWGFCRTDSCTNMASVIRRWRAGIERLPAIHERLKKVQIEQSNWREILDRYDGPQTLHYLDPPYVPSVRVFGGTSTR